MENQIEEIQAIEQKLHNLLLQKHSFQLELSEILSALKEIEKSNDEIFKVVGQVMVKVEKNKIKDELSDKKNMLELRIKSFEKQENLLMEKLEKLREEIMKR